MVSETRVYETDNRDHVSTVVNTMVRDLFEEISVKKEKGVWIITGIR